LSLADILKNQTDIQYFEKPLPIPKSVFGIPKNTNY